MKVYCDKLKMLAISHKAMTTEYNSYNYVPNTRDKMKS